MTGAAHIAIPPRLKRQGDGRLALATSAQDSTDQVADCVEVILRTRQGTRPLLPDFGRPDVEFEDDEEMISSLLQDAVDAFEDRREITVDAAFDPDSPGVLEAHVSIKDTDGDANELVLRLEDGDGP